MNTTNASTLEKANAAISKGDFEGFLAHCTDDIEWKMIGDETVIGKEAVREWMKRTYVKPPKFNVDNIVSDGDFVAVYGEIDLEDKKGENTHSQYCDVWGFREGKMSSLRAYAIETKN